jgi:hypothetical protein
MARESQIEDNIEVGKLAAPQVPLALELAVMKKSAKAIDALIANGLLSRKVLQIVAAKDKTYAKFLEPFVAMAPDRGAGPGGGAGKSPPKVGDKREYSIQNHNEKKNESRPPIVVLPLGMYQDAAKRDAKVSVSFEATRIVVEFVK